MKKYKRSMVLCLTACVLIFCGMLPAITAKIGDVLTDETVSYEKMKTVQLFRELGDIEKMRLLKEETFIAISEDRTRLKTETMTESLGTALLMYQDMGLILGNIHDFSVTCEPLRYYSNQYPDLSATIWNVQMELWDDRGQAIQLYLDDQTGKVLLISYECLEPIFYQSKIQRYLNLLMENYISTMDFSTALNDHFVDEQVNGSYSFKGLVYRMGDMVYGEIGIQFVMSEYGFRIFLE